MERRVRDISLEIFGRIRDGWKFATEITADVFRRETALSDAERVAIVEASRHLVRHFSRLEHLAAVAGLPPAGPAHDRALYEIFMALDRRIDLAAVARAVPDIDVEALALEISRQQRIASPVDRIVEVESIPRSMAEMMTADWGDEAVLLAARLNDHPPRTLRTNTLKIEREPLRELLAGEGISTQPTTYSPYGLIADAVANVFKTEAFQSGLFEVQDEASQLGAMLVAPPPRGLLIDACAGAGGKTLALAALMQGKGRIVALDIAEKKTVELRRRARRAGAHQIQAMPTAPDAWPAAVLADIEKADRIFLDAPCSGTGSLRRNPESKQQFSIADLDRLNAIQKGLILRAADSLKPGARIIYATCSILSRENEAIVESVLAERKDLSLVRVAEIWGKAFAGPLTDGSGTYLKLAPHRHGTDGFFGAVLRKAP